MNLPRCAAFLLQSTSSREHQLLLVPSLPWSNARHYSSYGGLLPSSAVMRHSRKVHNHHDGMMMMMMVTMSLPSRSFSRTHGPFSRRMARYVTSSSSTSSSSTTTTTATTATATTTQRSYHDTSHRNESQTRSVPVSDDKQNEFDACWGADSWSMNPDGDTRIDDVMQGLHSPAPQSIFIVQRALRHSTWRMESTRTVLEQCQYLIKDRYRFCHPKTDTNTTADRMIRHRPGTDWSIVRVNEPVPDGWQVVDNNVSTTTHPSASQIAAHILSLVADASESQNLAIDEKTIQQLLNKLNRRLDLTLGTDIRGRTAADTAFSLCLAGITDEILYEKLTYITKLEMDRVRKRSSRRAKDVLHVVEKLAAAGVRGPTAQTVYEIAKETTALSGDGKYEAIRTSLADPTRFHMLSTRPLLWLWRFSARQTKAKVQQSDEDFSQGSPIVPNDLGVQNKHWIKEFEDSTKPLVLDIGCGLGLSLIGLASVEDRMTNREASQQQLLPGLEWKNCNYLGGDLSLLGTRFGRGISTRWNLSHRLQFTLASAEDLIDQVDQLYDRVALIMIQFPSPYRIKESSGNLQLPSTVDSGFMVTEALMCRVARVARRSNGRVLLQSNCEDVAVTMHDMAQSVGLCAVPVREPVVSVPQKIPQRTQEWIQMGGKRAVGPEWSRSPLLPEGCSTETEASCVVHDTPVHRCVFRWNSDD